MVFSPMPSPGPLPEATRKGPASTGRPCRQLRYVWGRVRDAIRTENMRAGLCKETSDGAGKETKMPYLRDHVSRRGPILREGMPGAGVGMGELLPVVRGHNFRG